MDKNNGLCDEKFNEKAPNNSRISNSYNSNSRNGSVLLLSPGVIR